MIGFDTDLKDKRGGAAAVYRKVIKKMAALLCAVALFVGTKEGLRYLIVDDTASYTRLTLHEMYESESNIDILFVGASLVYRSLVPGVADDYFDAYTFNLGSSNQQMDASLVLIKEALMYHDVKQIYLEVSYDIALLEDNKDRTQMIGTYIVSDYLRPSLRKAIFLLRASTPEHYANSFIPARRNPEKLFDFAYIKELVKKKSDISYRSYECEWIRSKEAIDYYVDRGFVANDSVYEAALENLPECEPIDLSAISEDWKYYLKEIIDFCQKEGIQLTLFSAPKPKVTLTGKGNYDEYYMFMQELAEEAGVPYYDFNLCKAQYFDSEDMIYFKDGTHLNANGAKKFTELFASLFTQRITAEELFYTSYQEKLDHD